MINHEITLLLAIVHSDQDVTEKLLTQGVILLYIRLTNIWLTQGVSECYRIIYRTRDKFIYRLKAVCVHHNTKYSNLWIYIHIYMYDMIEWIVTLTSPSPPPSLPPSPPPPPPSAIAYTTLLCSLLLHASCSGVVSVWGARYPELFQRSGL